MGALLAVSSKATLTNWSQADLARCDWIAKAGKEAQADLWDGLPAIEHAGGRRQNDRTDPAKGVRRGRRASGLFRPVSRASRRRQPSTPSTPSTTCLLPLVRRYDPPLPRSWPKGFPARKPKPRPILFSISPVSLSKFRPSWDTAFSCPKSIVIEGKY